MLKTRRQQSVRRMLIINSLRMTWEKYEVSAYGAKHIETPNIDQIAKEGVLFQSAYCSAPVCAPSRAGIMTGRYQHSVWIRKHRKCNFYPTNFIEYVSGRYLVKHR